jgi:hypothetical protein
MLTYYTARDMSEISGLSENALKCMCASKKIGTKSLVPGKKGVRYKIIFSDKERNDLGYHRIKIERTENPERVLVYDEIKWNGSVKDSLYENPREFVSFLEAEKMSRWKQGTWKRWAHENWIECVRSSDKKIYVSIADIKRYGDLFKLADAGRLIKKRTGTCGHRNILYNLEKKGQIKLEITPSGDRAISRKELEKILVRKDNSKLGNEVNDKNLDDKISSLSESQAIVRLRKICNRAKLDYEDFLASLVEAGVVQYGAGYSVSDFTKNREAILDLSQEYSAKKEKNFQ